MDAGTNYGSATVNFKRQAARLRAGPASYVDRTVPWTPPLATVEPGTINKWLGAAADQLFRWARRAALTV